MGDKSKLCNGCGRWKENGVNVPLGNLTPWMPWMCVECIAQAFDILDEEPVIAIPVGIIRADALLHAAYGLLGDGQGEEWGDPETNEYTRGIAELLGDVMCIPGDDADRRHEVLRLLRLIRKAQS